MKKIFPLFLIICLLLSSCQLSNQGGFVLAETTTASTATEPVFRPVKQTEMRAIWISCYDHISAQGKSEKEYKAETDGMFRTIKDVGFNTAFVHMRAFSDAFYKSEIYPYSSYIAGKEGADLPFDPFEVILESAEKYGISVHGWINPFRISSKNDPSLISDSNPAKTILENGNSDGEIAILPSGIYYNPSHTENHRRIIDGVREIISNYDIDGIHIDDYFYPSTDEAVDEIQYSQYTSQGGLLPLEEWRMTNVNAFVSGLYSAVKSENENLVFSISPAAQLDKNYKELYADCRLWLSQKGYADMIIPQIYFGFEHETNAFDSLLLKWSNLEKHSDIRLVCGLGAYKCGFEDEYAGTGINEWIDNSDLLVRQLDAVRNNSNYSGFAVYSYRDLIRADCSEETENLKNYLKN